MRQDFFDGQLNVGTLSRQNRDTPRPDEQVEADDVEGGEEQTVRPKQGLHDGETDEARIGEDQRKFGDLALVQISEALAEEEGHSGHEGVKHHAHSYDNEAVGEIFHGEFRLYQRGDDHHRLADLDDQGGEALGGYVVDDALLAGEKAAGHKKEQSCNDGEKSGKIHDLIDPFGVARAERSVVGSVALQKIQLLLDPFHIQKHVLLFGGIPE